MRKFVAAISIAAFAGACVAGDLNGSGIVVLDQSAQGALTMVGNSTVKIPAKAVYVNSTHAQAVKTTGNALLDCPSLCVRGGTSFSGNSGCTGVISHPAVAYEDPMSSVSMPSSDGMPSMGTGAFSGGSINASPGYYPNGISITGNANVNFAPGVYVLKGQGLKVTSGSINAQGVCFVILAGSLNVAGASSIVMSPPSSGNCAGMIFAQPSSNTNAASLAGGSGVEMSGAIYTPSALITLTGNSTVEGQGPQMGDLVIAKTVKLAGTAVIKIGHPESQPIVLPTMPLYD